MANKEKFNQLINACSNPEAIMEALSALAKLGLFEQDEEEVA